MTNIDRPLRPTDAHREASFGRSVHGFFLGALMIGVSGIACADTASPAVPVIAAPTEPCPIGRIRRGLSCVDLDECAQVATPCGPPSATCRNVDGGYECTCPAGYVGGGPTGLACASRIVAGEFGTCAIPESDDPACVGLFNGNDAVGAPDSPMFAPQDVSDTRDVVAIATNQPDHTCLLFRDGHVSCWGRNRNGQLGLGTREFQYPEVDVPGLRDVVAIDTTIGSTCAIVRGGALYCWGMVVPGSSVVPERMPVDDVVQVSLDLSGVCALRRNGTVLCARQRYAADRPAPTTLVEIPGVADVVRIGVGHQRGVALRRDGTVLTWGGGTPNEYDIHAPESPDPSVRPVPGLTDVVELDAEYATTCYVTRAGATFCEGSLAQKLWNWPTDGPPVRVPTDVHAIALASGTLHGCILAASGEVACFGHFGSGEFEAPPGRRRPTSMFVATPRLDSRWHLLAPAQGAAP